MSSDSSPHPEKLNFQHVDFEEQTQPDGKRSRSRANSEEQYMHFRPQEIQSAPKFIQLEQGARNEPAIERPLTFVTKLKTIWWVREAAAEFFGVCSRS
jgi:hypothetical protein